MIKRSLLLFVLLIVKLSSASNYRGGRIEVDQISSNNFRITIYTYTKTSCIQCDLPILDSVYFGDGTPATSFARISKIDLADNITLSTYINNHTYASNGTFIIHYTDQSFESGLINLPDSAMLHFYLETEILINPFLCSNNSPHLFIYPIFSTPKGKDFVLSRAGYDPDWDSLSFELDTCFCSGSIPTPGYWIPPGVSLNPISGEFKWTGDSMISSGEYVFAIKTINWRHGFSIGFVQENFKIILDSISNANFDFVTNSYPIDFTSHVLPGNQFTLHVEYYDSTTTPHVGFLSEFLNNSLYTDTIINSTYTGNLTWSPSNADIRVTPYLLQFRGRKDLTYLVYVDGIPNDTCRPLVRIDEISHGNDNVKLFPNPVSNQFQIIIQGLENEKIKFTLFDMQGKIILKNNITNGEFQSVSFLPRGMYIIKLENSDKLYYRKIILN